MPVLNKVIGVALAATLLAGCSNFRQPEATPSETAPSASSSTADSEAQAKAELAGLITAPWHSMSGYSRTKFPHWQAQQGGCDTREVVLQRDGVDVRTESGCKIVGGSWTSPYDGITLIASSSVDIDHMIPLANAWRTGADEWDITKRAAFANDLERPQLFAVTQASNRAKGDQDPSQWKPPDRGYWCTYAKNWITVKAYWDLTVTEKERDALTDMLGTCN